MLVEFLWISQIAISICMDLATFKASKVSSPFFQDSNLMTDEVAKETGDVFFKFQNSTSWQSWHSSAHACTSSWLTNAERDAPVASVKVVVSASCLRGKRPSASSKLLRYLESQPMMYFLILYPPVFSKHDSKSNPRVKAYTGRYHSYWSCEKKTIQTKKSYTKVWNFVFSSFCASHFFSSRNDFCVDSTHLRIPTQPWPVWCLNQWGNQLSPPDPSGHNVPAKLPKMHEQAFDLYGYIQYRCTFRCSNQVTFSPFFWKIKCDIWKLFETDRQQLDPSPWSTSSHPEDFTTLLMRRSKILL